MDAIKVVLASPSDLKQERQMIKDLIDDEINPVISKSNLFIDLRRWEDTIPGINEKGAQGLIDLDLEIPQSDIFICLYGKKIGTIIPDEGVAGTEHELNTAIASYKNNHKPDIKAYFQVIEENSTPDYKEIKRISNRLQPMGLYGTFRDINDLKEQIHKMLMKVVIDRSGAKNEVASTTDTTDQSISQNKRNKKTKGTKSPSGTKKQSGTRIPRWLWIALPCLLLIALVCVYVFVIQTPIISRGDIVSFGSYYQLGTKENPIKADLEWTVLTVKDDQALLLSNMGLIYEAIEATEGRNKWASCSLKDWLNLDFYNLAFTEKQQNKILQTEITGDNVFCLSKQEVEEYVLSIPELIYCKPTEYAIDYCRKLPVSKGGKQPTPRPEGDYWWLRDAGNVRSFMTVNYDGVISTTGTLGTYRGIMVRPAIWVKAEGLGRYIVEPTPAS